MSFQDLTIIFNGEIYNHLELRKRFDLSCSTNSDTETILHLFNKQGIACLEAFDGMFAFAIYDASQNKLILARDRAGKKPLFYHKVGSQFAFASELNALHRQLQPSINDSSLFAYLHTGYFFQDATPYQSVYKLPGGSYAEYDLNSHDLSIKKWWDISNYYSTRSADDLPTALQKVDSKLTEAVERRINSSDLEVGSFLSGGIDSGLITAMAAATKPNLKTFTVSFRGGGYDESHLAKLVADRYSTSHTEIEISFDHLTTDVEKILSNYGLPFFDSSAIPSYYVSKEAKKHLTVILNGDGGDELFGGYRRYVPFSRFDFFSSPAALQAALKPLLRLLPNPRAKNNKYNYLYRLIDLATKSGFDCYSSATLDIFDGYSKNINGDRATAIAKYVDSFERVDRSNESGLRKILNLDFDHILEADLLIKMDIATMANSLEGRSPLLGKELLEFVPSLSDDLKVRGTTTKYLLRELGKKYLPAPIIDQPKRGFEIPLKDWVDGQLKTIISDYILSPNAYCRNYVKGEFIDSLMSKRINVAPEKRAKMIWSLFAMEVWYQKCYRWNSH